MEIRIHRKMLFSVRTNVGGHHVSPNTPNNTNMIIHGTEIGEVVSNFIEK